MARNAPSRGVTPVSQSPWPGRLGRALCVRHRDRGAGREAGAGRLALRQDGGVSCPLVGISGPVNPAADQAPRAARTVWPTNPGTFRQAGVGSASARASVLVGAWGGRRPRRGFGSVVVSGVGAGVAAGGGFAPARGFRVGRPSRWGSVHRWRRAKRYRSTASPRPLASRSPIRPHGRRPTVTAIPVDPSGQREAAAIANARTATTTTRNATPNGARRSLPTADAAPAGRARHGAARCCPACGPGRGGHG